MNNYVGIDMPKRTKNIDLDESELRTGDVVFAWIMGGLDPLLAYGTGTSVGKISNN